MPVTIKDLFCKTAAHTEEAAAPQHSSGLPAAGPAPPSWWLSRREISGRICPRTAAHAQSEWLCSHCQVGAARPLSRTSCSAIAGLHINPHNQHVAILDELGGCVVVSHDEVTKTFQHMSRAKEAGSTARTAEELHPSWQVPHGEIATYAGWSERNANVLAVACFSKTDVQLYNMGSQTQVPVCTLKAVCSNIGRPFSAGGGVCGLKFMTGGPFSLAVGNQLGKVLLWGKQPGQMPQGVLGVPKELGSLQAIETSSDGMIVYGATYSGSLLVWDVRKVGTSGAHQFAAAGPHLAGLLSEHNLHDLSSRVRSIASPISDVDINISSLYAMPQDPSKVLIVTLFGAILLLDVCTGELTHSCLGWMSSAPWRKTLPRGVTGCWSADGAAGRSSTFLMPYIKIAPEAVCNVHGIAAIDFDHRTSPFRLEDGKPWLEMHSRHSGSSSSICSADTLTHGPGVHAFHESVQLHVGDYADVARSTNANWHSLSAYATGLTQLDSGGGNIGQLGQLTGSQIDDACVEPVGTQGAVVVPWWEVSAPVKHLAVSRQTGLVLAGACNGDVLYLAS